MAADLEKLARKFQKDYPEFAASLHASAQVARKLGAPEHFPAETSSAKTPETHVEIKTFSKEALEFLKTRKELVYTLNGQSLKDQQLAGRPFWFIFSGGEEFLTFPSMRSEVAFNPSPEKFFLPESKNLTLPQQEEMIAEYSHKLQKEFGSDTIRAVMGDAPDYTSIAFQHLDATKAKGKAEYLFGKEYGGYDYARTKTPTSGSHVAHVGNFNADFGLCVDHLSPDDGHGYVRAAPLVVPA